MVIELWFMNSCKVNLHFLALMLCAPFYYFLSRKSISFSFAPFACLITEQMECFRHIHLVRVAILLCMICMLAMAICPIFHRTFLAALDSNQFIGTVIWTQLLCTVKEIIKIVNQPIQTTVWLILILLPMLCSAMVLPGVIYITKSFCLILDTLLNEIAYYCISFKQWCF